MSFSHSRSLDCLYFLTFVFCLPLLSFPQSERRKKRHTASSVHRFLLFCFFLALFICQVLFLFVCGVRRVAVAVVSCLPYLSDILHFDDEQPKELRCFTKFGFFSSEFLYSRVGRARTASFFFVCVCASLCVCAYVYVVRFYLFFSVISFLFSRLFLLFFFSPPSVFQLPSSRQHTSTHTHTHSILCAWLTERHVSLSMQRGKVFLTLTMRSASNTIDFYRIV